MLTEIKNIVIFCCFLALIVVSVLCFAEYFTKDELHTRITFAEMKNTNGIYTISMSAGLFLNKDVGFFYKHNSGDIQAKAMRLIGKDVVLIKYGFRIPFLLIYENVLDIELSP